MAHLLFPPQLVCHIFVFHSFWVDRGPLCADLPPEGYGSDTAAVHYTRSPPCQEMSECTHKRERGGKKSVIIKPCNTYFMMNKNKIPITADFSRQWVQSKVPRQIMPQKSQAFFCLSFNQMGYKHTWMKVVIFQHDTIALKLRILA